ncbi:MAG: helix-hairpin-helix domain-containing protein [Proteobacteria bacterium]|nr:helix-hairpin-helix domain-containing protein [Pseudomonadota bacterium]
MLTKYFTALRSRTPSSGRAATRQATGARRRCRPALLGLVAAAALFSLTDSAVRAQAKRKGPGAPAVANRNTASQKGSAVRAQAKRKGPGAPAVVNLNTASQKELEQLPGIGPAKARAILELRRRLGHFERPEQILKVRGIGRKTFRRLRKSLTVRNQSSQHIRPSRGAARRAPLTRAHRKSLQP